MDSIFVLDPARQMIMAWAGFSRSRKTDVFGVAQLANADDFGLTAGESTSVPKSSTF